MHARGGRARKRPKTGRRVRERNARQHSNHPGAQALQPALEGGEVSERRDSPVAEDDVRVTPEDRCHEVSDCGRVVLTVGVGVDDDVGSAAQRGFDADGERPRKTAVHWQPHNRCAARASGVRCRIGRTVVDDEDLDRIETVESTR